MSAVLATAAARRPWAAGALYGAMGLPLAFAALPLYVLLPQHYAERFGMPLATLGALLLAVRALDALWDPLVGRWADAAFARGRARALGWIGLASVMLWLGFAAALFPPASVVADGARLLAWCAAALAVTFLGFSGASVLHQAWAARLGGGDVAQSRLVAGREGAALAGVIVASALPAAAGWPATTALLAAALALGWLGLLAGPFAFPARTAPRRPSAHTGLQAESGRALPDRGPIGAATMSLWQPWRSAPFRRLLGVYLLNGIANAVPATLLLFYVQDVLQAPAWTAGLLASYFAAGALSLPLWVKAVARLGLRRTWGAGMVLAVAAFSAAISLGPGDAPWFLLVCLGSGLALGADLAAPPALLASTIGHAGEARRAEGLYFGWWTSATKFNLALAAGLALPLLQLAGYAPGTRTPEALSALALAYAALPCLLKLLALAALVRLGAFETTNSSTPS